MRQAHNASPQVTGEDRLEAYVCAHTHTNPSLGFVSREPTQKVCSKDVSCRMGGRLGDAGLDLVFLENYHLTFSENVGKR